MYAPTEPGLGIEIDIEQVLAHPYSTRLNFPLGLCRNSTQQIDFIELIWFSDLASAPM